MSAPEILGEIIQGYSEIPLNGYTYFFKHPTVSERLCIGKIESRLRVRGRTLNLSTKDELVASAIEHGAWSKELEDEIDSLKWSEKAYQKQLIKLSDPSLKREMEDKIKRGEDELNALDLRRRNLSIGSLEDYISSKLPSELCRDEIFTNESLSQKIDESLLKKLIPLYIDKNSELMNRESLLRAIYLSSFFDLFFIYDSVDKIFNKSIDQLTIFQKELIGYGRVLYSKLTKIPNIPDSIKADPLKLYFYEEKQTEKENETNVRKMVEGWGGVDNIKAEDKLT